MTTSLRRQCFRITLMISFKETVSIVGGLVVCKTRTRKQAVCRDSVVRSFICFYTLAAVILNTTCNVGRDRFLLRKCSRLLESPKIRNKQAVDLLRACKWALSSIIKVLNRDLKQVIKSVMFWVAFAEISKTWVSHTETWCVILDNCETFTGVRLRNINSCQVIKRNREWWEK